MFSLHETTQRRVCRVLFVVCCVLPTLATVGWIAHFYRPGRLGDLQRTLRAQLHVDATVDGVASPLPGVTTLNNLRLADLKSKDLLGRFGVVRCQWQNSRLVLHADLLEIEVAQLSQAATALATWLSSEALVPIDVQVDRVVFLGGPFDSATWQNLRVSSEKNGSQSISLKIEVEPTAEKLPVQLLVEHQSGPTGPSIHVTLDTLESTLPAWLLADFVPGGVHRSRAATFTGKTQMKWTAAELQGTLQGRFAEMELSEWLGSHTPHCLQGIAALELQNLVWKDRRIQVAAGHLHATRGSANPSLVNAASKLLECARTPACLRELARDSADIVRFDQLDFAFRLDGSGLSITGQGMPGCLLAYQDEQLLQQPPSKLPMTRLVRLLYLPVAGWLPDTQEAHQMASELPLPSARRQ